MTICLTSVEIGCILHRGKCIAHCLVNVKVTILLFDQMFCFSTCLYELRDTMTTQRVWLDVPLVREGV